MQRAKEIYYQLHGDRAILYRSQLNIIKNQLKKGYGDEEER